MADIDPTLSQVQRIQAAFDTENFVGATTPEGIVQHVFWHLGAGLGEKFAQYLAERAAGLEPDSNQLRDELVPDLIVFAAQLATALEIDLSEAYPRRLESLAERNGRLGSNVRAIEAGTTASQEI